MNNFVNDEDELVTILKLLSDDTDRIKIIEILKKLLSNLVSEPNNAAYKKLKKSNNILSNYIYNRVYLIRLLF